MDAGIVINVIPLWLIFTISMIVMMVSVEAGAWVASRYVKGNQIDPETPVGSLVAAMMGLLAFLLAFTFGMAMSRFDQRKQLLLDESNAIGTTYLRAGLLPADQKGEVRRLLREYVEVRLDTSRPNLPQVLKKSDELQLKLWEQAELLPRCDMDSELRMLFIGSLNEVIDMHESRKTVGLTHRIPGMVWLSLLILSCLAMLAIGYQIGEAGRRRLRGSPVLAAALALVITMIADIDRPGEGQFRVDQQAMKDVHEMILKTSGR